MINVTSKLSVIFNVFITAQAGNLMRIYFFRIFLQFANERQNLP